MKTLYDKFGTNQKKEQEGAWIFYDEELGFKVKRLSERNKSYSVAIERVERQLRRKTIKESEAEKKLVEIFIDHSLLDWKGVEKDGEPLPFNKENASWLLTNPEWPDFFKDILAKAHDNEYFKNVEEEAGN